MTAYELARELAARLLQEHPDLLPGVMPILKRLSPHKAGLGFASVRWNGVLYSFTAGQAAVVKILWEAWEQGTPDVRQTTLLMESGSECSKVSALFQGNPAWNTMIVAGPVKGAYRLNDAESPTGPATE